MYRFQPKQFQERKQAQEHAQVPEWDNGINTTFPTPSPMPPNASSEDSNLRVQVPNTQEFNMTTSQELALLDYQSQDKESSQEGPTQKRRKRGRPTDLSKAAKGIQDIRTFQQTQP